MADKRYIGIAEESSYGTPETATARFMDPESDEVGAADDSVLVFAGASGVDRIAKPGPYAVEGAFTVLADDVVTPLLWKLALGAVDTTGTGPFTHVFSVERLINLPSFTLRSGRDLLEKVFSGCVVNSLALELDDDIVRMTVDVMGAKDEKGTFEDPLAFDTGNVFAPHEVTAMIDGVDESARVEAFSLNIETGANIDDGRTVGSRHPRRAYPGGLLVELELTLSFIDTQELERFWGGANGPGTALTEFPIVLSLGANYDISLPRCVYPISAENLGGRGRIEQTVSARALRDSATGEIITVSITNDETSY